jgi:hypothetical protein
VRQPSGALARNTPDLRPSNAAQAVIWPADVHHMIKRLGKFDAQWEEELQTGRLSQRHLFLVKAHEPFRSQFLGVGHVQQIRRRTRLLESAVNADLVRSSQHVPPIGLEVTTVWHPGIRRGAGPATARPRHTSPLELLARPPAPLPSPAPADPTPLMNSFEPRLDVLPPSQRAEAHAADRPAH